MPMPSMMMPFVATVFAILLAVGGGGSGRHGRGALAAAGDDASIQALRVRFVNELPNTSIELYWENHAYPADDPVNRRRLEAIVPPRGGWHLSQTFVGHGKHHNSF